MATTSVSATLDLVPSDEETMLRETVASICREFGRPYMRRKVNEGQPALEL